MCQQHSTNIRHPLKNNENAVNADKQFTITVHTSLRSASTESDTSLEEISFEELSDITGFTASDESCFQKGYQNVGLSLLKQTLHVHRTQFGNVKPLLGSVYMITSPLRMISVSHLVVVFRFPNAVIQCEKASRPACRDLILEFAEIIHVESGMRIFPYEHAVSVTRMK